MTMEENKPKLQRALSTVEDLKLFESVQIEDDNIDDHNVRKEMSENNDVGIDSYKNYLSLGKIHNLFFIGLFSLVYILTSCYSYYFYNSASRK